MPKRIQLSRRAGFDLQAVSRALNGLPARSVARPGPHGNPYKVGDVVHRGPSFSGRNEVVRDKAHAVQLFRASRFNLKDAERIAALAGHNLACWCALDEPCHADVLIELANPGV